MIITISGQIGHGKSLRASYLAYLLEERDSVYGLPPASYLKKVFGPDITPFLESRMASCKPFPFIGHLPYPKRTKQVVPEPFKRPKL